MVKIPDTKTHTQRVFTIQSDVSNNIDFLGFIRRYIALRPEHMASFRFFVRYVSGKCSAQNVGINMIGSVPRNIAEYLKLASANEYTGHCFRRSSATLLVDAGGDLTSLKRHGGWKSSTVAEGYIDDSVVNKTVTAKRILLGNSTERDSRYDTVETQETTNVENSTRKEQINYSRNHIDEPDIEAPTEAGVTISKALLQSTAGFTVQNCNNWTFNLNIYNK